MNQITQIILIVALILVLPFIKRFLANKLSGTMENKVSPDPVEGYRKVGAAQAKAMVENEGYTILDVRRPDEYAEAHIEGAVNHAIENLDSIEESFPDKETKLLVHCKGGTRAKRAVEAMLAEGYSNVVDMGGIKDWPYGTVK